MSAHRFWSDFSLASLDSTVPGGDPGSGKALPNSVSGVVPIVTGASGETNTLADPTGPGLLLILAMQTDGGGDRTVTVASAVDDAGTTSLVFADAQDTVVLLSIPVGTGYKWRKVLTGTTSAELASLGVTATAAEINSALDGILATFTELNRAADVSTRVVNVTATPLAVTVAAHDGKILVLDKADGLAITLPDADAEAVGAEFEFVIKTTISSASTIKSSRSADIMIGHAIMGNDSDNSVVNWPSVAGSTNDTIDLLGTSNSTGGLAGQRIYIKCLAANLWYVEIIGDAAGTEASPFANTVS